VAPAAGGQSTGPGSRSSSAGKMANDNTTPSPLSRARHRLNFPTGCRLLKYLSPFRQPPRCPCLLRRAALLRPRATLRERPRFPDLPAFRRPAGRAERGLRVPAFPRVFFALGRALARVPDALGAFLAAGRR